MYFHFKVILSELYYSLAIHTGINSIPERFSKKKPNTKTMYNIMGVLYHGYLHSKGEREFGSIKIYIIEYSKARLLNISSSHKKKIKKIRVLN